MHAVILAIGDELVLGQTVDTNSAYLSGQLAQMGIATVYHQTVGDDVERIARAITEAAQAAALVLITGGLGPTEDDLTRQALARAMGVELVEDEPSLRAIEQMFARRCQPMPQRNRVQAMHPRSSQMIPNRCGTAPGIMASLYEATVYVTPGVPQELFDMFQTVIGPQIQPPAPGPTPGSTPGPGPGPDRGRGRGRNIILTATVSTFGIGESTVAQQLAELCDRGRNPLVGTTVARGMVGVRIRSESGDEATARAALEDTVVQVQQRLGPLAFGRDEQTLGQVLVQMLKKRQLTLATAESCSGGLLGKMLTDVPGASSIYVGGWVTYSNDMKVQLGVDESLLRQHGAVSEPVVEAMARSVVQRCGTDLGLAITGIAGPGGATDDKPVGSVWVAVARRNDDGGAAVGTRALLLSLWGDRPMIRHLAAASVLQMLRLHLIGSPWEQLSFAQKVSHEHRS